MDTVILPGISGINVLIQPKLMIDMRINNV